MQGEKNALDEQLFITSQKIFQAESHSQSLLERLRLNLNDLIEARKIFASEVVPPEEEMSFDLAQFSLPLYQKQWDKAMDVIKEELRDDIGKIKDKPAALLKIQELERELLEFKRKFYSIESEDALLKE